MMTFGAHQGCQVTGVGMMCAGTMWLGMTMRRSHVFHLHKQEIQ